MSQWGNVDQANNSPIWGPVSVKLQANTTNRDNLYNNTTANAFTTNTAFANGYRAGVFGVAPGEMSDSSMGQVANVQVTAAGSGYTSRPGVTFSGGGGSGATAQATSKVVSATIYQAGSGYSNGDVIQIDTTGFTGALTAAKFDVTTNASGNVTALAINAAGTFIALTGNIANNQTSNVTGAGTGLFINLSFGVLAVTMTANGNNYTSAPTATFSGGGSGTTVTVNLRSEQSKVPAAGWNLRKVLPNGRVQYECLVAMGSITDPGGGDSDDSVLPD